MPTSFLTCRRVLVTGASKGLGRVIAEAFARRQAHVIVVARESTELHQCAVDLGAEAIAADLTTTEGIDAVASACGQVDVLVSSAGLAVVGPHHTLSADDIDAMLALNVRAPTLLTRALLPRMNPQGHIVFVGSLAGSIPSANHAVYAATKFALRGFAHALRQETDVRVSIVNPTAIDHGSKWSLSGRTTAEQVARSVIRAVSRNRAEIAVAPLHARVGARVALALPELLSILRRR